MGFFSFFGGSGQKSSNNSSIEDTELLQDLPEAQKKYFVTEDLKLRIETKKAEAEEETLSAINERPSPSALHRGNAMLSPEELRALEKYKRENTRRAAVLENCSEIQMLLLRCLKTGSYTEKFTLCNDRTRAMFSCIDAQKQALAQLGFESARSVREAESIKGLADDLFVKHFGQDGLNNSDESKARFADELENITISLWK